MAGTIDILGTNERQQVGRGSKSTALRVDNSGSIVMSGSGLSRFGEAVFKGQVFSAVSPTLTLAASGGNLVGSTAAQATNTCLFNPSGSGKVLVLLRVAVSVNSGTFAAGGVYHGLASGQTIATSISGAARGTSHLAGSGAASTGYVFTSASQATLTGGAAPVQLSPIGGTTATAAANGYVLQVVEEMDGLIVLPPGGQYQPLWTGVGTTVIYNCGYTWLEVESNLV